MHKNLRIKYFLILFGLLVLWFLSYYIGAWVGFLSWYDTCFTEIDICQWSGLGWRNWSKWDLFCNIYYSLGWVIIILFMIWIFKLWGATLYTYLHNRKFLYFLLFVVGAVSILWAVFIYLVWYIDACIYTYPSLANHINIVNNDFLQYVSDIYNFYNID